MEYKVCTHCKESKPYSDFYKKTVGISSKCKICTCNGHKEKRAKGRVMTENEKLLEICQRRCSCCGQVKSTDQFFKKKNSYEGICKLCKETRRLAHYDKHPEISKKATEKNRQRKIDDPEFVDRLKAYAAAYYQANKEDHNAWVKDWNRRNPEKRSAMYKRWRTVNLDLCCWHSNARRVRKLRAVPTWAKTEWEVFITKELYHLAALRKECLGIDYQVDHVVPLKSDLVCGLHCFDNLQLLSKQDNLSKGNRHWPDMW